MLYDATVPQFVKMLTNLGAILDKAAAHAEARKFDVNVLLDCRLAPDMFPFTRQIQILCDTAKRCAAQLAGKEAPVHEDKEKTLTELRARVQSVIEYLNGFSPAEFAAAASRKVTSPRWDGQYLSGEEFTFQHAIPNFYFHMTAAYAILRHNGVEIGKKDYLGKMPFKR